MVDDPHGFRRRVGVSCPDLSDDHVPRFGSFIENATTVDRSPVFGFGADVSEVLLYRFPLKREPR